MLPPPKPRAAGTHRALEGLWDSAALLLSSPLCGAQCVYKGKENPPPNLSGFPCTWENPCLPRDRERAADRGRDEYTLPSRPRDQSRTSGPCHPCREAAKGIQVALGKWRKAEERQAAAKTACCQEVRTLPRGPALLQPSPPCSTSGVGGVRAHRNVTCQQ